MKMNAPLKIGFDGEVPEFREARDLDGKGRRQAILGPQNINVDRLEWLLAHKRIDAAQHAAGRRLQADSEQAQIGGFQTLQGPGGGSGTTRLSDAKCDAIGRVNAARVHVGGSGWRMIEMVALENISLEKAAGRLRINTRGALPVLQAALDTLVSHYDSCAPVR